MIESILAEAANTNFDFRHFAAPHDPLSHLFEQWVAYYRLKFAIAKVLQPKSILEIGVRYGYSAITFLSACPEATYYGIDLEVDAFGGVVGALDWARKITQRYDAKFLVADTQQMERFPGDRYDLIHIDGQQDGAGTFHDLRRAISQGKWVLLDGYYWTQENFVNANDFLIKFKDAISYTLTIPSYAGELLIRTSDVYLQSCAPHSAAASSAEITRFYDSDYYGRDCGGYEDFIRYRGRSIEDPRLLSLLALARLARGRKALDLGCGRGEIVYQLAANGFNVTGVDYSSASINIARSCFEGAGADLLNRVLLRQASLADLALDQQFDLVIAGDVIEHLSVQELDHVYATISAALTRDGVFVIHTAPNKWFYKRGYKRRKQIVERLGGYMAAEPRKRFELLLHINEQSPAGLRRQLTRFFPFVRVWLAESKTPVGSLQDKPSLKRLTDYYDIYAVAALSSRTDGEIRSVLTPAIVSEGEHSKILLRVEAWPDTVSANERFSIPISVTNHSRHTLSSLLPHPVRLSYHWLKPDGAALIFSGVRTAIPFGLAPGETSQIETQVEAPHISGDFILETTVVQENCAWFESKPGFRSQKKSVKVYPPSTQKHALHG